MTFAPPPDAIDLVVREVTPPPTSPHDRSELSDTETPTTSSSDDHGESSISEGQLVISHGEMRARTKPRRLPGMNKTFFLTQAKFCNIFPNGFYQGDPTLPAMGTEIPLSKFQVHIYTNTILGSNQSSFRMYDYKQSTLNF